MSAEPESRYAFARQPKWIISHILVFVLVVTMINLGFWQLRRLHGKRAHNAVVTARMDLPPVPVSGIDLNNPRSEFRRVFVTGSYVPGQEVIVRGRSLDEAPGSWVLSPLRIDGSTETVVINRGWIANDGRYTALPAVAKAPTGRVAVTGLVQASESRGAFGATDPATGHLTNLARADIVRLQKQVPEHLQSSYIQLQTQVPAPTAVAPKPLPPPTLDEGPHLSYAIQWFVFSAIALLGYPFILRRTAREKERRRESPAPDTEHAAARTD